MAFPIRVQKLLHGVRRAETTSIWNRTIQKRNARLFFPASLLLPAKNESKAWHLDRLT